MVLSEVLNELSTITLFVERERGDVEFDSIRVFVFLNETQLNVNLGNGISPDNKVSKPSDGCYRFRGGCHL